VARAIIGGYGVVIAFFVLKPSSPKAVEDTPAPVARAATTGIPSVEDPAFGDFIENEANFNRWIDTAE